MTKEELIAKLEKFDASITELKATKSETTNKLLEDKLDSQITEIKTDIQAVKDLIKTYGKNEGEKTWFEKLFLDDDDE